MISKLGVFVIAAVSALLLTVSAWGQQVFDIPTSLDDNWTTGPAVGERIPDFQGVDQNGVSRSFNDIKGPNGAYVLFHRSADW